MKEIDILLKKWIKNSIIRKEVKAVVAKEIDNAYKTGLKAGLDYKLNTNTNG